METVLLKNGSTEAKTLVIVILTSISSLMKSNPMAFYDLVMKCRDSSYKFFGNNIDILLKLSLVQSSSETGRSGHIHSSIKNIVLSAVEGEGLELNIVSPYPDTNF